MAQDSNEPSSDRLFAYPPYLLFWTARSLSAFAVQMAAVATGWLVYQLTHSAYFLGLIGLAQFVPVLLLTLPAGHIADRFDRRRIVAICQFIEGAALALLAIGVLGRWLSLGEIFAAVAVLGAAQAFERPTMAALLPSLVPPRILPRAIAMSSSANQSANIIGPAAGGLLYAVHVAVPFTAAAGLMLAAAILVTAISARPKAAGAREKATLASVFSGIAFIRARPILMGAISLDLFAVLLGGATALLPIFADNILGTGPWGLGVLRAGPAAGALVMSIVLTRMSLRRRVGTKLFVAVAAFGLATILFALSRNIVLSFVALVAVGAADNVSVVIRSSLVQLGTPDAVRGRVNAVNSLFIGTSNQLGEFESGITAGLMGAVPAVLLGGAATIAVAIIWMRLFPALRQVEGLAAGPTD
ncbi:MAG: MFS transporter [Stellaceae bacterium]